jgi:hypothetical protein
MKSTGSPTIDAYIDRYGKIIPVEVAVAIAKKHGISQTEVLADHRGLTVKTKEFFNWLGY